MLPVDTLDDHEVDQLLAGRVPAGRDDLAPLASMVASLRSTFSGRHDRVDTAVMRRHVVPARMAHLMTTDNGDPAAMPVSKADRPRREVSGLPKWRRSPVSALLTSLLSSVAGKVAVGAVSLAAVTGAVAMNVDDPNEAKIVSTVADTDDESDDDADAASTDDSTVTTTADDTSDTTAGATTDDDTTETTVATTDTTAADGEAAETDAEAEAPTGETAPKDNHGADVSEAAKDHDRDDECGTHGQAVSQVARGLDECTPPPGKVEREAAEPAAPPARAQIAAPDHKGSAASGKGSPAAAADEPATDTSTAVDGAVEPAAETSDAAGSGARAGAGGGNGKGSGK